MTTAVPVRCPLLVGRDGLLDVAERRLDEVEAGQGRFLLVAGTAGIGKTRYLAAVTQRAEARGFGSVWSSVTPMDQDLPAASIADLARAMDRIPAYAELGRELRALRAKTVEPHPAQRRDLALEIVDRIVAALVRPTVIGFEDLQWADELSLEVIGELVRGARASRLLVLGGYRSDEAPLGSALRAWRSTMVTQRLAEELRLGALTKSETALATSLILDNGLPAPRDVAAAVFDRTDGIPLHIEELLGALDPETRMDGAAIREATVPDTIEDAVIARLSRRSPAAQDAARAGAVIGRSFDAVTLAAVMERPVEALDDPLQELIDAFILEPPPIGRVTYDFRHQLLRDAIYRSTTTGDRRRLHARAAVASSGLEGHSVIHASLHYEIAGQRDAAFASALEGAHDAARLFAHREAFDLYRRAERLTPPDLPIGERAALYEAVAMEANALERIDVATDAALASAAAYREAGHPELGVRIMEVVASMDRRQGRPASERLGAAHDNLAVLADSPLTPAIRQIRAMALVRLAVAQLDLRDLDGAGATVAQAAEDARASDDREVELMARALGSMIDAHHGQVASGLDALGRIAVAMEAIGSLEALGTYRDAAELATQHLRYPEAIALIEDGTRYAQRVEQRHCAHVMASTAAFIDWARGDWDSAVMRAGQAIADDGCERARAIARWPLGLVALGRGDRTAVATLEAATTFAASDEGVDLWATPWWALAEADLLAGRSADARGRCAVAADRLLEPGPRALLVPFVVTAVRADVAAGQRRSAGEWLATVGGALADDPGCAPMGAVALKHGRGLVALAEGATGVAREALGSAVTGWEAAERTWEASWARLDLATCLTRTHDFAAALAAADTVRATALRLGSGVLLERAEAVARLARGRIATDEPWRPLTAREFAVARLVAQGQTNAEIAAELGIAPKTASSHVEHILAKLGASRRAEIARWTSSVDREVAH